MSLLKINTREIMHFWGPFSHKKLSFILKVEDHKIHLKILIMHDLKTFKNRIRAHSNASTHIHKVIFLFHCSFSINCKDTIIMDGSGERRRTREMTKKLLHKFNVLFSLSHSLTQLSLSPRLTFFRSLLCCLYFRRERIYLRKKSDGWNS